ncbi:MAG: hypothetical protein ACREJC_15585, partial [Tepidisphaeraceae bacterium]
MSCWVVPTVAADVWGVSVQHILEQVRHGTIPHKSEEGFLFVDIAPESPQLEPAPTSARQPLSYTVVTSEEVAALATAPGSAQWSSVRDTVARSRRPPAAETA